MAAVPYRSGPPVGIVDVVSARDAPLRHVGGALDVRAVHVEEDDVREGRHGVLASYSR
jgi:hypothetical protein